MLASADGLSCGPVSVCLSVCLSVTSQSSIETTERIELIFGKETSFHLSYTVLKRNSRISKNKGTSLWTLSHTPVLLRHIDC